MENIINVLQRAPGCSNSFIQVGMYILYLQQVLSTLFRRVNLKMDKVFETYSTQKIATRRNLVDYSLYNYVFASAYIRRKKVIY